MYKFQETHQKINQFMIKGDMEKELVLDNCICFEMLIIPEGVKHLKANHVEINDLPSCLPNSLLTLDLSHSDIKNISVLPPNLQSLKLYHVRSLTYISAEMPLEINLLTYGSAYEQEQKRMQKQIQDTFNQIKKESGVEPEEDYMSELEQMFGFSMDEITEANMSFLKTKKVGVELLYEDTKVPTYAYPSDSGFDLYSRIDHTLPAFGRALIPTGLKLSIPEEYEIQVRPKSGLAINMGLTVLNTPGTVDSGYVGEIQVIVFNTNNYSVTISKGMKVAQAVLCPVVNGKYVEFDVVDKVGDKDRGDKGFGSTGI
jgi:dUTP pyrophosphatase